MRTVVVDKIASVTQACGLGNEVRVATDNIPAEEGVVVVVEILTNKSTYNTLELTSGRMAKVGKGDIVAGALGHRKALFLSSQARVTGKVHVLFRPGSLFIEGVESPHSLMAVSKGVYGESHGEWSPQDALGFSKIVSLTGMFHARAAERARSSGAS